MSKAQDVVLDRILAIMDTGTLPWQQPWDSKVGFPKNLFSKRAYSGVNVWMLACQGYDSPYWATFKQISAAGGTVKKGSKATPIVFWNVSQKEDAATGKVKKSTFLVYYNVFNVAQTEGLEVPAIESVESRFTPIEVCEKLVGNMPLRPSIFHGGIGAFYTPSRDTVTMPDRTTFTNPDSYYSTLFHELGHSTGHESRLNRPTITDCKPFGSVSYAKEELIAEMTASYLCGVAGIDNATANNSAAYIKGWMATLQHDRSMLISAASKAQKAADYIQNLYQTPEVEGE